MKLKSYIMMAAACALFACNSDNEPVIELPTVSEPDATLALLVDADSNVLTKSTTDEYEALENTVQKLTVAVFNDGAYTELGMGKLVKLKTANKAENEELNKLEEIPVKSGPIKVLVLANVPDGVLADFDEDSTLDDFYAATTTLSTDETTSLTMSSQVYAVTTKRGKTNCMGYKVVDGKVMDGTEEVENGESIFQTTAEEPAIKLYRSIARVRLTELTVKTNTNYGEATAFTLHNVFLANVKEKSYLANAAAAGTLEVTAPTTDPEAGAFWRYGLVNTWMTGITEWTTGQYNTNATQTFLGDICYTFETEGKALTPGTKLEGDVMGSVGRPFYVYENMKTAELQTQKTLFLIRGDYTYIPKNATEPVTEENRFWTIVVNPVGNYYDHAYIKRNFSYNLQVTLTGPGSSKPFDPEAWINVNAQIVVNPWGVVDIKEDLN